jgi:lambda family phage portal protein
MKIFNLDISFAKKTPEKGSKRRYEGASKNKRLSKWLTPNRGANAALLNDNQTLRNRARDLRRNNAYAAKAVMIYSSNVIGTGIRTQFTKEGSSSSDLPIEKLWKEWAHTTECDYDGRHDLFGLQKILAEAEFESGEVLVRFRFDSQSKFPLKLQVLESDFIDTNMDGATKDGNIIVQGIEFDRSGKRVAYYLFETHPGENRASGKSNKIPADEILHIFDTLRPGQVRGVTRLAPVIVRMKDLDDFEDAQLMRQKIAACFTAFVRDINIETLDTDLDIDVDVAERMEPAMIEHLPPGKTVEFANPPGVQNYKEYTSVVLHGIASGMGLTYEALTGDFSEVNFSSGRMGWIEFFRNVQKWQKQIVIGQFLNPVVKEFLKIAKIIGAEADVKTYHIPPKREMIDPTKEIAATINSIKGGLSNLSEELAALGKDPVEHLTQYKKDMDLLDSLGLQIQSDPRIPDEPGRPVGG